MNRLIKEGISSTSLLCNLQEQIQKLLDNEARWSRYNAYLQSLPTNQIPSIIEPVFSKNDDQCNYNEGFIENQLGRLQTILFSLLEKIQLIDVIEIWKLYGLTKSYKYYVILLADGGHLCTCLTIINHGLKKKPINDTNNKNENVQILVPVVQKQRGHLPNKCIKSATEFNSYYVNTKNSAINPSDPNLYVSEIQNQQASSSSLRIPFNAIDINTDDQKYEKKVYICKICKQKGHNARTCSKQHQ
ncbi:unnamed protein product [Rhizophagus irregularis]|nr:unnamed protein product [Rhizophagus irregularis]